MRVVSLLSCVCMWFLVTTRFRWYQNKIKDIMAYFQFRNKPEKGKWFSPTKSIIKTCQHGFFPHGPFPRVALSLAESKIWIYDLRIQAQWAHGIAGALGYVWQLLCSPHSWWGEGEWRTSHAVSKFWVCTALLAFWCLNLCVSIQLFCHKIIFSHLLHFWHVLHPKPEMEESWCESRYSFQVVKLIFLSFYLFIYFLIDRVARAYNIYLTDVKSNSAQA